MGLTSTEMKRLLDCGVTPEALLIVTEIIEERDERHGIRDGDRDATMSPAERSRAYRQRKRDAAVTKPRDDSVTPSPTPPVEVVTTVSKEVSEQKEVKGSGSARVGTRIPPDFIPDASCEKVARELGYKNGQWKACLAEFKDYWVGVAGAKGRKLDWQATFRNRLRTFIERKPYGTRQSDFNTAFDNLERRLAGEHPPDDGGEGF